MMSPDNRNASRVARWMGALVLLTLGVGVTAIAPANVHAQAADSVPLHAEAVRAVQTYEVAAFHYWPSIARDCTTGRGSRACAGGWCEPSGRAVCVMGRVVPCPEPSSIGKPVFCDRDAQTLGPAHRTRDSAQIISERTQLLATLAPVAQRL